MTSVTLPSPKIPQTSADWLAYFEQNRYDLLTPPWNTPYFLTSEEKTAIAHSIQNFQLGEQSEGTNLMKAARVYVERSGDTAFLQAMKLFIGEEQRHARDLGNFMQCEGIPLREKHWSDRLFRRFRRGVNLEVALRVLLTAEIIATIYYKALQEATHSPLLQKICEQILKDEHQHLHFQVNHLRRLQEQRKPWQQKASNYLNYLFLMLTILVVWIDHYRVFLHSGYRLRDIYQHCDRLSKNLLKIT
ncbi:ferritin-like domain-containing protein [Spirulina sp. 06S082]|uniref:ferritin-like domain-containing protein n=1 Tax=Spirulina sp. 06S082 TaxID=3110248 RepID=UPI002B1FDB1C|nr:ferritin-like domain-containing protein [Spirulina sp. 06S082]MEA5471755.1 ferritin-like domain-containing protein [Spirulina sp. 06S082]